jgi:dethiobiotin synthetase
MSGFFITGTDTGIGKTFITCALIHALQQRGLTVAPMKPIAAGTIVVDGGEMNEDVALFMAATDHRYAMADINPYCFAEPIAPHLAALHDGGSIEIDVIHVAYRRLAADADVVLVEGAGGFLVPMSAGESMALIPAALRLPVILVAGMRLGCLNHALLTAEAIASRGLILAGWVANTSGATMSAYAENLSTLQQRLRAPLLGELPHIESHNMLQAARIAATHLHTELLIPPTEQS